MLRHHGAVQVEIDGIERTGGCDAVDHHLHDALEGILGDVRRRARAAGDRRNEFPAIFVSAVDEAGKADIDASHHFQDVGPFSHRRPCAGTRSESDAQAD